MYEMALEIVGLQPYALMLRIGALIPLAIISPVAHDEGHETMYMYTPSRALYVHLERV